MEVSIPRQVGQLKILVVLLIFGVPLQQLATAQSAQQSANNAAAYAAKADAAAAAAQNASYDAQQTLATDQSNGAISDQLLEDKNVANATQTASIGASDAAQQADKAASDAQTAANLAIPPPPLQMPSKHKKERQWPARKTISHRRRI